MESDESGKEKGAVERIDTNTNTPNKTPTTTDAAKNESVVDKQLSDLPTKSESNKTTDTQYSDIPGTSQASTSFSIRPFDAVLSCPSTSKDPPASSSLSSSPSSPPPSTEKQTQTPVVCYRPDMAAYYQRIQRIDNDVYLACDRSTKTNFYAIKLFQLDTIDDIDFKLLTHDLQICKQLRHPNILQYYNNFIHQDQLWIISPLCSFTSADRLSKPLGLPELAIAFIIRDTLHALDYLHRNGLIHRSVRASHILINSNGRCLLTGMKYSIDCICDGKRQPYMHQYPSKARPNINWFSPEILEQNLFGYNHKSDIYSLGITCCELANGVVPFSDLQPTEMLLDKLTGNAPRLLDQTCQELINLRPNEMNSKDRDKFYVFRCRQFSSSFHTFTSGLCLNFDPQKRPDAKKLLSHNFIKQLKRSPASSLLDFLDPALQVMPKSGCDSAHKQQQQQLRKQESVNTTTSDSTDSAGSDRGNIGISQKQPLL